MKLIKQNRMILLACVLAFSAAALTGCNYPASQVTPTGEPALDATQAWETVQARLTEAIALTQTATPEPSATPSPTATPTLAATTPVGTTTPATSTATATVNTACDQASPGNPIDITIPDDTEMAPGQAFSKTWRLVNSGTCTWTSSYALQFFSGELMGAPTRVPLNASVAPGSSVDLTVDMIAPTTPGTYQSNWKLSNASNQVFGLGSGGLAFYVRIVVVAAATTTASPEPSVTVTPTPGAQAQGPATMLSGDVIDLDTNQVNGGGTADLSYLLDPGDSKYYLTPENGALISIYGGFKPTLDDCRAASLGSARINMDEMVVGTYMCYRTNQSLTGWARLTGFDLATGRLNLDIYTWEVE